MGKEHEEDEAGKYIESRGNGGYWNIWKKNVILVVIIALFLVLSITSVLDRPLQGIDSRATVYLNKTTLKAGTTFLLARALNATISMFQESMVGVTFIGKFDLAVGELLDPVNDLVEKFSSVMLVSTVALGIQKLLLEIGKWIGFKILLTSTLILFLVAVCLPDRMEGAKPKVRAFALRILIFAVVVRIAIPVVAVVSSGVNNVFLEKRYEAATAELEKADSEGKKSKYLFDGIEEKRESKVVDSKGTYSDESLMGEEVGGTERKGWGRGVKINIRDVLNSLTDTLSRAAHFIIELIVIFILQTIIIPLLTLWCLLRLVRVVLSEQLYSAAAGATRRMFRGKGLLKSGFKS
jgi:hypothetical protein